MLRLDLEDPKELLVEAVGLVERVKDLGGLEACTVVAQHRLERAAAARVRRIDHQRLAVRLDGRGDVAELDLPDLAEARQDLELVARRLGKREIGLERVGQILPAVRQLVERRERRERSAIGPEVVDDGAVREDRRRHVRQLLGERPRDAHHQRAARVAIVALALRALAEPRRAPASSACARRGGRAPRALARRSGRPRAVRARPRWRRAGRRARSRTARRGAASSSRRASLLSSSRTSIAKDLAELLAVAARIDALERAARGERDGRVVGRELQDLPVHRLGARRVVELVLAEARDVHQDLGAGDRRARGGRGRREDARRALVCAEAARDLEHPLTRPGVVGVEREQARERLEGAGVVAQPLVAQLGHAAEQVAPLVGLRRELEVDLEHAHELGDLVAARVDGLEHDRRARAELRHVEDLLDELARLRGARPLAQHLLEVRQRARRVAELREEQRPEALVEVELLVAHGALPSALEEPSEPVPALLGCVERVERPHRLLVHGVDLEDALVVADGLRPIAGDLLGDERDLGEQLRPACHVAGGLDDSLVERSELGPLLAGREDLLEALEGALVARLPREHPLEVGRRAIDVPELLVEQSRRALREIELDALGQAGRPLLRDCRYEGGGEGLRSTRVGREPGQTIPERQLGGELARRARDDVERAFASPSLPSCTSARRP